MTIPDGLFVSLVILGTLVCFYLYYYISHSKSFEKFFNNGSDHVKKEVSLFMSKKITGFVILGIIPGILYYGIGSIPLKSLGIGINNLNSNILLIIILSALIISILYFNQKSNPERNSLQMKIENWTFLLFSMNCLGWVLYLFGYELLFRGILLDSCYTAFGFWPAIAINVAIYSAIHMINGKDQAIGSIIFGTIACYFTLSFGTILIPLIMHITLSLFADFFSIYMNEELKFVQKIENQVL